ncbi:MAG: 3'-phosphoadenosine 5'-phosphosulfate sulfotransferase (PAPS reductase)/FAD synthetase [Enterobacterales bacterium]|jgi:3'-phosphoadenosine 5'-phosphosulfate sulfotransferase (PAPS reductase)/FAD synthetase
MAIYRQTRKRKSSELPTKLWPLLLCHYQIKSSYRLTRICLYLHLLSLTPISCHPLTGAIESEENGLASIVLELLSAKISEREGRPIDSDSSASMEKKKQEGYF